MDRSEINRALAKAADQWDAVANAAAAPYPATTYRDAAKALRIQIDTGVAVCSCCFKPFSAGPTFLRR